MEPAGGGLGCTACDLGGSDSRGGNSWSESLAAHVSRVWRTLHDDWRSKTQQIATLEQELAGILVKTPYLLLLSLPGINVVSVGELAGEMGPIEHYAHPRAVTGRAGLFPSRYQSDEVDRADGPLAHLRNARLRAARCGACFRWFRDKSSTVIPAVWIAVM